MYPINPPKDEFNLWLGADDVSAINKQFENLAAKVTSGEFVVSASQAKEDGADLLTVTIENHGSGFAATVKKMTFAFKDWAQYSEAEATFSIARPDGKILNFKYTDVPRAFLADVKKLGQVNVAEQARISRNQGTLKAVRLNCFR